MKLLVMVLCLLGERFLMHSLSYKRFIWFGLYCNKILPYIENFQLRYLRLPLLILPIIICVAVIYFLLKGIFFGFAGLILSLLIFFYCIGPQNPFYPVSKNPDEAQFDSIGNYFAQVNVELFALIFWYIIGGPIAALIYRLITLCSEVVLVSYEARQVSDVLEWIPARITVLLYLLLGNFQRGFPLFIHYIRSKPASNSTMLSECGLLALRSNETDEISMVAAENLVEQACIVLMVLISLFTLVAWL